MILAVLCVPAKNQVLTSPLSLYMIKAKGTGKETTLSINSKTPSIKWHIVSALLLTSPQLDQVVAFFFSVLSLQFTKTKTDKFILVQYIELQKCLRSPQFCVCLSQVLTSPLTFPVPLY